MKKTYIIPMLVITAIQSEGLIAESTLSSMSVNSDEGSVSKGDAWVKENRSDYNVWSDDWSK